MAFDRDEHKRQWNLQRGRHNTALVNRWKVRQGCECCGYKAHHAGLVLDHLDQNTKDRNKRSKSYNPLWSKNRIKEEIAKCRVLCATCHNVHTYESKHYLFRGGELGSTGVKVNVEFIG